MLDGGVEEVVLVEEWRRRWCWGASEWRRWYWGASEGGTLAAEFWDSGVRGPP